MNRFVAVVILFAVAIGCRPKSQPTRVPEANPAATNMVSVDDRISELQKYSVQLTAVTKNLPGRDQSEDRQLLADGFDHAVSALALLMGPEPHGAFRQQLRIIDNVRRDVRSGSATDATVDSGVRSVFNALIGVRERLFVTDQRVGPQLDNLRDRVLDLDSVRGPLHSVAVASAFQAAAATIETMRLELVDRFAATQSIAPSTQAASHPQ
jgi:hypothetical protein